MVNEEKLENCLLDLGFVDSQLGTHYIRRAVLAHRPGVGMTTEIYPAIAAACDSTSSRVERAIRHATQSAWGRGSVFVQNKIFGHSISPDTGCPTNSELIARLARVCNED